MALALVGIIVPFVFRATCRVPLRLSLWLGTVSLQRIPSLLLRRRAGPRLGLYGVGA